jgi:hypothetical protein
MGIARLLLIEAYLVALLGYPGVLLGYRVLYYCHCSTNAVYGISVIPVRSLQVTFGVTGRVNSTAFV